MLYILFEANVIASTLGNVLGSAAQTIVLAAISPWLILAALSFIIGGVGLYAGREKPKQPYEVNRRYESQTTTPSYQPAKTRPPANSGFKSAALVLLLIGGLFVLANFAYPHMVMVETSVQVPNQVQVPNESTLYSQSDFTLQSNYYQYNYPRAVSAGNTVKLTWSADISLAAYIFTQNQFNYYNTSGSFNANYMATGSGRSGALTYDVKDTDSFVGVINNNNGGLFGGGASAQVYQFKLSSVSYTTKTEYTTQTQMVPQNDNLYLYIGVIFVVLGILVYYVSRSRQL